MDNFGNPPFTFHCFYGRNRLTRLLLAEDEKILAQAIIYALEREGMVATHAKNGEEAIYLLDNYTYDMAILDITMPKVDGLEVARHIRKRQDIPVLFLTALSGESVVLSGFELGADDYLTKPFSYKELLVRVKAILRRGQAVSRQTASEASLSLDRLSIDSGSHIAKMDGEMIPLTLTEFHILAYLLNNVGRACGGKEILKIVRGYEAEEYEAREILRVHVQHLRQKMKTKKGDPEHVENVHGVGYMIK